MSNAYPNDKIRSSVVFDANSQCFYFTSRYTDSSTSTYTGEVWQLPYLAIFQSGTLATLAYNVTLSNASTSTPVISDNEYVYVGTYNDFTSGTVEAVSVYLFPGTPTKIIYSGGPVQASPIVYSDGVEDYIYFTTNSGTGKGYCYYFDTSSPTTPATLEWSAGGNSANPYAEQGFASDNGYLVYGDDSNNLYIMH